MFVGVGVLVKVRVDVGTLVKVGVDAGVLGKSRESGVGSQE